MRIDLNRRNAPHLVSNVGLRHLEARLRGRVAAFKLAVSDEVYRWLVPPSNSHFRSVTWPYFSGYFRSNWDVSINSRKTAPIYPETDRPKASQAPVEQYSSMVRKYAARINPEYFIQSMSNSSADTIVSSPILIYNNTWYGKWLNDGGYNPETILEFWPPERKGASGQSGYDFMHKCYREILKDIPSLSGKARQYFTQYFDK